MNQPPLNPDALEAGHEAYRRAYFKDGAPAPRCFEKGLSAYLAAALPEVTSVEAVPGEKLAAQIILRVDVMLGVDPGTDTPNAFEPPYEYLVIRGAEALKAEAIIQSGIFQVVGEGVFDDADPDSVLVEAVTQGLSGLSATSPEVTSVEPQEHYLCVCGKYITLTKAGVFRHHLGKEKEYPGSPWSKVCEGSGKKP